DLIKLIHDKQQELREYLNRRERRALKIHDPVRIKNLEKIIGHLDRLLVFLVPSGEGTYDEQKIASLQSILDQITAPENISFSSAWELADMLEVQLVRFGDDVYILTLLKALEASIDADEKSGMSSQNVKKADINGLLEGYFNGKFKEHHKLQEARQLLEYLLQAQISGYRRDRAKALLRGNYLRIIAASISVSIALLAIFFSLAEKGKNNPDYINYLILTVIFAGALGSILSRAIKLGKQPLDEKSKTSEETPLGIRALISWWKVFFAQPAIGAASALILFFVFYSGLVKIDELALGPSHYSVLGFLAGFSEAYFIGILDRVAGSTGGSLQ
ncbi:MAG TPA: hypothetical protein HA257_05290, partial [Candidatus Methanoperedenaceae archaeon]|nr:hypothetical protein [Candidatus Methanoperedenaceae archaeon]